MHFIDECPVAILEENDQFWPIIGKQKLSREPYDNKQELEKRIKRTDWPLIIPVLIETVKMMAEYTEIQEKHKIKQ